MDYNFKYYKLNSLVLASTLIKFLFIFIIPTDGICSNSAKEYITHLERISDAHGQLLMQLQQQISDNKNEIDLLRGQIQENKYRLDRILKQQNLPISQLEKNTNLTSNIDTEYNSVIAIVQDKSKQEEAIVALHNFTKKYPDSIYQSNINYWLGQLNYYRGKKDDAISYFASVVKNYPNTSKAPDAMYKVGIIMQDKGDILKAKAVYQQVIIRYPNTNSARESQKRLSLLRY